MKGIINKPEVLKNIYDEATEEEKSIIKNILSMWKLTGKTTYIQEKMADEIIKKYRPEYYKN